jgi:glycerol-3-phosphate dehydrogenase (NAD(P)+)
MGHRSMNKLQTIAVVGGGAWGTALATVAARAGRDVLLWVHEPQVAEAINSSQENTTYLPGIPLDPAIKATSDMSDLVGTDACLLVPPAQHLRAVTRGLHDVLQKGTLVAICAKGVEQNSGKLMGEVVRETLPDAIPAILSGPSFAADVARGLPTAVTLACEEESAAISLVEAVGSPTFRPYWTSDVIGTQIGGAMKNVLAIACGIVDGKAFGESARAALTARGFAEMVRLGKRLGAAPETMSGLSGLGDLILTCSSPQSRNMSLGMALGSGTPLKDILNNRKSVAEGVHTAAAIKTMGAKRHLDMPICDAVADIVSGIQSVDEAINSLLARPFTAEV